MALKKMGFKLLLKIRRLETWLSRFLTAVIPCQKIETVVHLGCTPSVRNASPAMIVRLALPLEGKDAGTACFGFYWTICMVWS